MGDIIVECVDSYDENIAKCRKRIKLLEDKVRELTDMIELERLNSMAVSKRFEIQIVALDKFVRDQDKKYDADLKKCHNKIADLQSYVYCNINP